MDIWRLVQVIDLTLFSWRNLPVCLPGLLLLLLVCAAWAGKSGHNIRGLRLKLPGYRTVLFWLGQSILYVIGSCLTLALFKIFAPSAPGLVPFFTVALSVVAIIGAVYLGLQLALFKIITPKTRAEIQLRWSVLELAIGFALMPVAIFYLLFLRLSPICGFNLTDNADRLLMPLIIKCSNKTRISTAASIVALSFCASQLVLLAMTWPALVGNLDFATLELAKHATTVSLAISTFFYSLMGMVTAFSRSSKNPAVIAQPG